MTSITDVVKLARYRLGFNSSLNQEVFDVTLRSIQSDLETGATRLPLPWFLFDYSTTVTLAAGSRTVAAPERFIALDDDFPLLATVDGVEVELKRRNFSELTSDMASEGSPKYFVFDGATFYVFPLADQEYTIRVPCYRRSAQAITAVDEHDWVKEFPNLIEEQLVMRVARATRDKGAMQAVDLKSVMDQYYIRVEAMKHTLQEYVMDSEG